MITGAQMCTKTAHIKILKHLHPDDAQHTHVKTHGV